MVGYIGYESEYDLGGFNYIQDSRNAIVRNGLVIYLDAVNKNSYPGSGTTWFDLSGNGRHGTLQSGVTYSTNGHFSFDGSTGHVTLPLISTANTNLTIQTMIYLPSISTKGTLFVTGNASGFALGIGGTTFDNVGNDIIGLFPGIRWIDTNITYGPVGWYLMTMSLDASGVPTIYRNTTLVGTYSGTAAKVPATNSYIGRTIGDEPVGERAFSGFMSVFWAYNKVLSNAEIQQNFNAVRGRYGI